ncbi:Gfo/Idh/MocA family oxidoreductase [Acidobacteria bacterium AB60]|nr:Gfo/Idh/MocA family oxidoreductase [Acidobacteria bacterium AB60]
MPRRQNQPQHHSRRPSAVNAQPELIRWGVIGPGRAAGRFAQGLAGVPNTALHAVWGRNPARALDYAQRFNVPHLAADIPSLLAAPIQAVYVATHPDTHAAFCCAALDSGKHVLCEKPAALNVPQLESILEAAHRNGRLFMEAMKPPFFPLYQKLRARLAADPIGSIGFVRAGHCDSTLSPDYPLHFRELGGGSILGIGPYEAFLALDWLGDLKRVHAIGRLNEHGVDSFALFQTEHARGMAQLHTGIDLLSLGDALLCAPGGYVRIHANWWNPARATIHYRDGREVLLDEPFLHGGFNYETAHFCNLVRGGNRESPEITHALSLAMARLLQDARLQLGVQFPGE